MSALLALLVGALVTVLVVGAVVIVDSVTDHSGTRQARRRGRG